MIPVNLRLSNFTSYGASVPELDFSKFHLAAISGPNGAGKSSILDAITWCVWGWSRAGDSADNLIRLGQDEMYVEFTFQLDQNEFTVKRRRSRKHSGQTALEFWSGINNLTEGTIKATQQKIVDTLHLTFETFTNSSFLRQGHADEFTTKGATDRKRILADILGLAHYDLLEEKAKDRAKDVGTKLSLLEYQFLEIEAELSQKEVRQKQLLETQLRVTETETKIKLLEEEIKILTKEKETINIVLEQQNKMQQNLQVHQQELDQIMAQGKERAERIKNLELRIKNLEEIDKRLETLKNAQKELDSLRLQKDKRLQLELLLGEFNSKLTLKKIQKNHFDQEIKKIELELTDLEKEGAKCPTCGQEIGKDSTHDIISKVKSQKSKLGEELEKIKTANEEGEIKKLEDSLGLLKFDTQKLSQLENSLKELDSLQQQKEKVLQDQATLESEKKTVDELRALFKNKQEQVKKLEAEFASLPKIEASSDISTRLADKENLLVSLRNDENEARSLLGRASELISRSEQLEKLFEQKKAEKQVLQKEKDSFEELALAFGKKGIQAMIIETAIPEIEDEANNLLTKLTEGRMKVSFQTQKETKTKVETSEGKMHTVVETLDIIISDEMGERPYEMYSGGEAFRVNFAIRLALSKLLTRRAGAKLQFLIIDEGFGTQDVEGRTRIVEVMDTIKNDFEKILIITHLEELKEEFPTRIEVSKNSTGSTFQVIGE